MFGFVCGQMTCGTKFSIEIITFTPCTLTPLLCIAFVPIWHIQFTVIRHTEIAYKWNFFFFSVQIHMHSTQHTSIWDVMIFWNLQSQMYKTNHVHMETNNSDIENERNQTKSLLFGPKLNALCVWQRHWHSSTFFLFLSLPQVVNCLFWLYAIKQQFFSFLSHFQQSQYHFTYFGCTGIEKKNFLYTISIFAIFSSLFLSSNNRRKIKWREKKRNWISSRKPNRFLLNFPKKEIRIRKLIKTIENAHLIRL